MTQQSRSSFGGGGNDNPRRNPAKKLAEGKYEPYDPRLESVRSIRQAIYESQIMRDHGGSGEFRDASGQRFEVREGLVDNKPLLERYASQYAFGMATGVAQNKGFLVPGSQQPTTRATEKSYQRYHDDPDHLLLNRQDYEETLSMARKSDFYRVVAEPTFKGERYFVWPLRPGDGIPVGYSTLGEAQQVCDIFNERYNPFRTGRWWTPPRNLYTQNDLKDWLPPDSAFGLGRK